MGKLTPLGAGEPGGQFVALFGVLGTTKVEIDLMARFGPQSPGLTLAWFLWPVAVFGPCDHGSFLALGPGVVFGAGAEECGSEAMNMN